MPTPETLRGGPHRLAPTSACSHSSIHGWSNSHGSARQSSSLGGMLLLQLIRPLLDLAERNNHADQESPLSRRSSPRALAAPSTDPSSLGSLEHSLHSVRLACFGLPTRNLVFIIFPSNSE